MALLYKLIPVCRRVAPISKFVPQIRESSYKSSLFLEDVGPIKRNYEVTRVPEDWEYVKRVLAPATVPEPPKKDSFASGWKPQEDRLDGRPYYVARSKNHMIPVYLIFAYNKTKKTTIVRHIRGDIWLLEKEIKEFLQPQFYLPIRTQVNEFVGYIRIHGDYVNAVKYFLEKKGY